MQILARAGLHFIGVHCAVRDFAIDGLARFKRLGRRLSP